MATTSFWKRASRVALACTAVTAMVAADDPKDP